MTESVQIDSVVRRDSPISLPFPPVLTCDGNGLRLMVWSGLRWLEGHYRIVNQLNVFPVPDGDTGTNMLMTLRAAHTAAEALSPLPTVEQAAQAIADGALHGSRGNSGTVLSQLFVGIAHTLTGKTVITAPDLAAAFQAAVRMAYATFNQPKEGTILSVARAVSEAVSAAAPTTPDLRTLMEVGLAAGQAALARTPDQLPILKQAGVVDSGGQGLVYILEGMVRALNGQSLSEIVLENAPAPITAEALDGAYALSAENDEDGFGFDVQFIIHGENMDVPTIRAAVSGMGHSAIVIGTPETVKVHVHVPDPEIPLSYGRGWGRLTEIVVEDMQAQSEAYRAERVGRALPADQIAVVAVAPGEGIGQTLYDLGVAHVVAGGQTMNPSTGDIVAAIRASRAGRVIVLPNNSNVQLTAEQAAQLIMTGREPRQAVYVLPTRSVPQGVAAMLGYTPDGETEEVLAAMRERIGAVRTGEVTRATRALVWEGLDVKAGQTIGLIDDQLALVAETPEEAVSLLLFAMQADQHEVVTIFYGDGVRAEDAEALAELLAGQFPRQQIEVLWGGQPYYPFIIGVE